MKTCQNTKTAELKIRVAELQERVAKIAYMNKEQIFEIVSELIDLSDEINNYVHSLDLAIAEAGDMVIQNHIDEHITASKLELLVKNAVSPYKADRDWAERQLAIIRDIRIATLSAQRSAEG